ncbi:MAG: type II toxin-antitoxin system VapC family toxin [Candidatus Thorarchaeota archaeon]
MMKKSKVYLEASALWNLFYGEPGSNLVEFCLAQEQVSCSSSVWSYLEIHRGIKKRVNQKEITIDEGHDLKRFIDSHLHRLVSRKKLLEFDVSRNLIEMAKELISTYNLYAADALHFSTAISDNCLGILVDDYHFTRIGKKVSKELGIMIWPTSMSVDKFSSELKGL